MSSANSGPPLFTAPSSLLVFTETVREERERENHSNWQEKSNSCYYHIPSLAPTCEHIFKLQPPKMQPTHLRRVLTFWSFPFDRKYRGIRNDSSLPERLPPHIPVSRPTRGPEEAREEPRYSFYRGSSGIWAWVTFWRRGQLPRSTSFRFVGL